MQTVPHELRSATLPLPDQRRVPLFGTPATSDIGGHVRKYFETSGVSRWTAIYGSGDIPPIWKVIRDGHQRAIDAVLSFLEDDSHTTALDAGCGTGNLAIELANRGYRVDAFDVSAPMIHFAKYTATKGGTVRS
jgi:2-polyprenyl-3-methyl-5-hydroxy-6-metoxy-1,4-benzoquinol methylase